VYGLGSALICVGLGKVARCDGSGDAFAYSSAISGCVSWEGDAVIFSEFVVS
jgi:hypothetical protein